MHQLGDLFDQLGFLHLVGNFSDDNLVAAALHLFGAPLRPEPETTATRFVGFQDTVLRFHKNAACWEVRTRDQIYQFADSRIWAFDQVQQRSADFTYIVRWDIRRHTDRNSG